MADSIGDRLIAGKAARHVAQRFVRIAARVPQRGGKRRIDRAELRNLRLEI
jgi:hypothetical protein